MPATKPEAAAAARPLQSWVPLVWLTVRGGFSRGAPCSGALGVAAAFCIRAFQSPVALRRQPQLWPKASRASLPLLPLLPVSTAWPPSRAATLWLKASAPAAWPPSSGMAKAPWGSTTTTAGSWFLPCSSGAISRVTRPQAPTTTKPWALPHWDWSSSLAVGSEPLSTVRWISPAWRRSSSRPLASGLKDSPQMVVGLLTRPSAPEVRPGAPCVLA